MRYQLKQKFWSMGSRFVIHDDAGEPMFQVIGKAFSWGDKLSFQDMAGEELARIEQQMWNLMPKYEVLIGGQPFAEIRREWSWFKKRFTLDVPGPNDYTITGSFWDQEYRFERGGETVATTSKKFFSWGDTYGVDIDDGENQLAILCTAVVIDLVSDRDGAAAAAAS